MDAASVQDLLGFAHDLADAAALVTLRHFRTGIAAEDKGAVDGSRYDPVTEADRGAEDAIRALIVRHHPSHGIMGEEHGTQAGQSDLQWVIDPIDGTRAFITGMPLWGTLIALNRGGQPFLGIMDQPFLRERFAGTPQGAWANGRPIRTRACATLPDAALMTTDPTLFRGAELEAFQQVRGACRLTRYGGDCYAYCLLAAGHIDLVVEAGLQAYDVQALIPIVEGAGGRMTDWRGGSAAAGGRVVAAGDPRLHAEVLRILSAVP
ncbi:histidinol-phosphatase [Zavarzinia sp. CC-PAN008]|uniref:histidinol-phosphatase n=1 Tax=Zavarzinia sp. CC-PAN008 TaxID=3243332 RepID=UPI003F743D73